jgi:glutathione S-transferase
MTPPIITAFATSPDEGQGLARDMRVRWALEELKQAYDVRLMSFEALKQPEHLRLHPFGQIPTWEEGELALFESGAIVLHLAQTRPGLLPEEPVARSRAIAWLFAALNTVEPPIVEIEQCMLLEGDRPWHRERLPLMEERVLARLASLSRWLGDGDWLEGEFTAGDLMMVMVLRRAEGMGLVERFPNLLAYVARGQARRAYRRAFEAQKAVFTGRAGR